MSESDPSELDDGYRTGAASAGGAGAGAAVAGAAASAAGEGGAAGRTGSAVAEELLDEYRGAGFGGRLGWGRKPALVVIDVCRAYVDEDSPLYAGVEQACESAGRLVDTARASGVPVIFTRVEFEPGGVDGGMFFQKVPALACFERGNPLADWLESPRPVPGEVVVTKQYASAFFGTSLAATLTSMGIDTLVICGLSTSGCVRATGIDAVQHGFRPMVVADACGDRATGPHEANLFDLNAKYADVVDEHEALTELKRLGPVLPLTS